MHSDIFTDPAILFIAATASLILFKLLKAPAVLGYLAAGMLIGPYGFGLLENYHQVHTIAEVGVILLLFTIGLEVSPTRLWQLKHQALIGGNLQVIITAALATTAAYLIGIPLTTAIVIGFFVSLSSTAVVLRLLNEKSAMDSSHGRNSLAVLLLQDVIVVPMAIIVPLLGESFVGITSILIILGKSLLFLTGAVVLAKLIIPWVIDRVAALRSREGFLLAISTIVIGTAWTTSKMGMSPALGAFLAGVVISETEYKHVTLSEAVPFRDMFLAVFFVSVGTLVNFKIIIDDPLIPIGLALAIYSVKTLVIFAIFRFMKYPASTALKSGVALGQIGEFSLVILFIAEKAHLTTDEITQPLLAVAALTILITPLMINLVDRYFNRSNHQGQRKIDDLPEAAEKITVVIGYGMSGRMVVQVLKRLAIPYKIAEGNPLTVKNEKKRGEPIILGDASKPEILEALQIHHARAAIIAISNVEAIRPIVQQIRTLTPDCHIIVRMKYAPQLKECHRMGIHDVVLEDMEASIAIADRVLRFMGETDEEVHIHLAELREEALHPHI